MGDRCAVVGDADQPKGFVFYASDVFSGKTVALLLLYFSQASACKATNCMEEFLMDEFH